MSTEDIKLNRTWLRAGRLFIRDGWFDGENGERYIIQGGELTLKEGYLRVALTEDRPPADPDGGPFDRAPREDRRSGRDRRLVHRRKDDEHTTT